MKSFLRLDCYFVLCFLSFFFAFMLTTAAHAETNGDPDIGKHLYRSYCFLCHGMDGKSKGPLAKKLSLKPADLSSEYYRMKKEEELAIIIGGYGKKEGSSMPSWSKVLPEVNLRHLAAYISKLSNKDIKFRGNIRRGNIRRENIRRGRVIYKSACAACHGRKGTGNGILASLIKISMIDFTKSEDMKQISGEELIRIIIEGQGDYMPSWKGHFTDSEIIDVAAFVQSLGR